MKGAITQNMKSLVTSVGSAGTTQERRNGSLYRTSESYANENGTIKLVLENMPNVCNLRSYLHDAEDNAVMYHFHYFLFFFLFWFPYPFLFLFLWVCVLTKMERLSSVRKTCLTCTICAPNFLSLFSFNFFQLPFSVSFCTLFFVSFFISFFHLLFCFVFFSSSLSFLFAKWCAKILFLFFSTISSDCSH